MPLTQLDPATALIAIDLQKGVAAAATQPPIADVVRRTARLARAFRARGLPVVFVNVTGAAPGRTESEGAGSVRARLASMPPDWTELVPELEAQPGDHRVTKQRWGAFLGTGLDADLRARGVTQIVLTGVATSIGVESTARSAYDLGYHVTLVTDATADRDPASHRHSVERIFPRLGETGTTDEVLRLLEDRSAVK